MRSRWTRSAPAVLAIVLAVSTTTDAADAPDLLFPLPGNPALTSSFGEYRSGHYHGGLDLSTGGREGLPVAAPADGWVLRLRASGIGYGRAVYFRLADGRTVLFAHLSRFSPAITRAVLDVQDRLGRYEVDFTPEPGSLSFRAGDILGYSGASGAGPPHLHAEIRVGAAAAVAVNPLGQGWTTTDTVPPELSRLRVEPSHAGVRVNNGIDPVVIDLGDAVSPVTVTGPVRLWVEANDTAGEGSYRLAPHTVGARLAGVTVLEVVFDRFNWNWAQEVEWTYNNALARMQGERWICLDSPPRARQSMALVEEAEWTAGLTPGVHRLTLFGTDMAGNRSESEIPIVIEAPVSAGEALGAQVDHTALLSRGSFLDLRVATTDSGRVYGISPDGRRVDAGWTGWPCRGGWIYQLEEPQPRVPGLWSFGLHRAGGDSVVGYAVWLGQGSEEDTLSWTAPGGIRMEAPPAATYGPLWIDIETASRVEPGAGVSPELMPLGPVVHLGPRAWPLRERITVTLDPGGGLPSRRGLAVHSLGHDTWSFDGADTAGVGISTRIRRLESLALFRDLTPPVILIRRDRLTPRELAVEITDGGVGVVWTGLRMILDGENLVAEWDPEAGNLIAHLRSELAPGDHELRVEAADRVGNRSEEKMNFSIP